MPRVTFVNEHRVVEVEQGRLVSDVAKDLGIAFRREIFAGTGLGDSTVWIKGPEGCVSPPGFVERWKGARGWRRFADRTRILGDCSIYTQPGLGNRLGVPRDLAPAPSPMADPSQLRAPDAAATAAFPYGHPSAVGKGERPAVARGAGAEAKKAKAAKPAAAAVPAAEAAPAVEAVKPETVPVEAQASAAAAPAGDAAAEKAARIAEKKARQAALKARLAVGAEEAPVEAQPAVEASAPVEAQPAVEASAPVEAQPAVEVSAAVAEAKPAVEASAAVEGKPAMDPEKAARIAEKKARQAALKARLAAPDPKPEGSEGG